MKKFNPNNRDHQSDHARMTLAVVASLLVLFLFHFLVDRPRQEALRIEAQKQAEAVAQKKAGVVMDDGKPLSRDEALKGGDRVQIEGGKITGSINLTGARLDDLLLLGHTTTVDDKTPVALLTPKAAPHAYYVENGFLASSDNLSVPGEDTRWSLKPGSPRTVIADGAPVTLLWNNGAGVTFEQDIALDQNYLFTITQRVINKSGAEIAVNPYALTARQGLPIDFKGFFVQHEGPVSVLNGEGEEGKYKNLAEGEVEEQQGVRGWTGISDKYWLVALLPEPQQKFNARSIGTKNAQGPVFQSDAVLPQVTIANGQAAETRMHVYAGVKDMQVIKGYQQKYGFDALEYGIDFGIWYFLTKPLFYLLHWLSALTGNIAAAILLITVIIRGLVYPLASKSFRSMAKMKIVAPAIKELQDKYKDDREKLQTEIFELYKREDVNPFSGCWPMLIQIPIFFSLYKVILISVELRHAPFWGWIRDLSAPDPTSIFNLFGLLPFTPPQALMIGAWPLLFCLSMVFQQRMSPPMTDRTQEIMQKTFPYIVTLMLAHFSVGLVIYWTWSNVLSALQQYYIQKSLGGQDVSLIRGHAERRKKKKPAKNV